MSTPAVTASTFDGIPAALTATTARAPWPIYAVLFASTSVVLGVIWDI